MTFEFNFAYHDQRLAANMVFVMGSKEGYQNIRKPSYIHADGAVDPLGMGVPRSWEQLDRLPCEGVFRCEYMCAPKDRNLNWRWKNLETYGMWRIEYAVVEVEWWASTYGVHDDVLELLLFLRQKYTRSVEDSFTDVCCTTRSDTGASLSLTKFIVGLKAIRFERFRVHDPDTHEERLKGVYRFLDQNNSGTVSKEEYSIIGSLCREVQLSIHEFATFVDRMFGDFDEAWSYFDDILTGNDIALDLHEWEVMCDKAGYFGPVRPIFNYLCGDDGEVSWHDFECLEEFIDEHSCISPA